MPKEITSRQKKIDMVRNERTKNCRTICIGSLTSTLHLVVPLIKVLHRLGTVQVLTEDKSLCLIRKDLESEFRVGDITIRHVDELILFDPEDFENFKQYDYNIVVVNEFIPEVRIDKFIFLNRRHHFREQITDVAQRFIPIVSVFDPKLYAKDELANEKGLTYVNEKLLEAPSFVTVEQGVSSLLHGHGSTEFRFNARVIDFIAKTLDGIEECTPSHIKRILMERGEIFDNLN